MNIVLWIVQVLLALVFIAAGSMKFIQPEFLKKNLRWMNPGFIKPIGTLEILGALGLIFPALTHVLSWLTPLAAVGLAIIMVGATVAHFRQHETLAVVPTGVLLLLCLLIIYGRFVLVPLT